MLMLCSVRPRPDHLWLNVAFGCTSSALRQLKPATIWKMNIVKDIQKTIEKKKVIGSTPDNRLAPG